MTTEEDLKQLTEIKNKASELNVSIKNYRGNLKYYGRAYKGRKQEPYENLGYALELLKTKLTDVKHTINKYKEEV